MGKYLEVSTDFWHDPIVLEEMSGEEKLFYLYLLMNQHTTPEGIYHITRKQIAFELDFSIELVQELLERFIEDYELISYDSETRELIINSSRTRSYVECIILS